MSLQKCIISIIFIFINIHAICQTVLAQEDKLEPPKKRIAVLNFSANNVDESLARIVRNNIELNLFKLGKFEVLEHDQVDFILQERKLLLSECMDEDCGTKIGEMLSAQYVILGSVSRLDKFIVQIKVIDAAEKKLIIVEKTEAEKEGDLRDVSIDLSNIIAEEIENIGKKAKPLFFSTGFLYISPLNYLHDKVDPGFGVVFSARIEDVFIDNLFFGLDVQYLYFNGKAGITHHAFMLPAALFAGYRFPVWRFSFVPSIAGGLTYNSVYYYLEYNSSDYSKDSAFEAIARAGFGIEYNVTASFHLNVASAYNVIFEKDGEIEFVSYCIGAGMRF